MTQGRVVAAVAALVAGLGLAAGAHAKPIVKCGVTPKCTDRAVVADAYDRVDDACPCGAAATAKAYKQCWKPVLKAMQQELGKTGFPKACKTEVTKGLNASLCGKPGFVLCRKEKKNGDVICQVTKETKCDEAFPPSSSCGAFINCAEACDPTDCTTTSTTLQPTTTVTTTSTSTTSSSTSSTAITTSTIATTTSTSSSSTSSTVATTTTSSTIVGSTTSTTIAGSTTSTSVPSTTSTTATTSTTSPPSTTSTTVPTTTSTSVPSTTSTTIATTTSTSVPSTTSTTVPSTTSTTVVSTTSTSTTVPPSTTSTTIPGSTTSTSVPPSTTTTTAPPTTTSTVAPSTTSTSVPPTTTSTTVPPSTTSTSVPPSTTSTSVPPSTTSTSLPPTTTSTSVPPTTTSTSIPPSTTTTSTTTPTTTTTSTLPIPSGTVLAFTTGPAGGVCGETREGGASGTVLKNLTCGGLNIGGGAATVPEGPTPAGATTLFNTSCAGPLCTVTARTAAETGSNNNCSDVGCAFGPWLSIANGGLSTCVRNTFAQAGSGTVNSTTGNFDGSIPLQSAVTVTGVGANPCPDCVAGACGAGSTNVGAACTAVNAAGDSHECIPSGVALVPFGVDLTPIGTGTVSLTGPTFCSGQDATPPGINGCFANPTCDYIEERGTDAGALTPGTHAGTLASIFCIPATGNGLIDGSADLPGPGATSLPGTLELIP